MTKFKGARAAIESIRLISGNSRTFVKLVTAWALITSVVTFAYCWFAKPAGADATFGDNLIAMSRRDLGTGFSIHLLPDIFANLVVSVGWIKLILLDDAPTNPVRLTHEMGNYFLKLIQISFLMIASAIPGMIVALVLGQALTGMTGRILMVLCIGLLAVIPALVIISRLGIVLAAASVDEEMSIGQAFEATKGHSAGMATGLFLSYFIPNLVLIAAAFVAGMVIGSGFRLAGGIGLELVKDFGTNTTLAVVAGFNALAYKALVPGDPGGKIAKAFE